jgi:hypothetical protein
MGANLQELVEALPERHRKCVATLRERVTVLSERPFLRESRQALSGMRMLADGSTWTTSFATKDQYVIGTYAIGMVYEIRGKLPDPDDPSSLGAFIEAGMTETELAFSNSSGMPTVLNSREKPWQAVPSDEVLLDFLRASATHSLEGLARNIPLSDDAPPDSSRLHVSVAGLSSPRQVASVRCWQSDLTELFPEATITVQCDVERTLPPTRAQLFAEFYAFGPDDNSEVERVSKPISEFQKFVEDKGLLLRDATSPTILATTGVIEDSLLVFDTRKPEKLQHFWLQPVVVAFPWSSELALEDRLRSLPEIVAKLKSLGGSLHAGEGSVLRPVRNYWFTEPTWGTTSSALDVVADRAASQEVELSETLAGVKINLELANHAAAWKGVRLGELRELRAFPQTQNRGTEGRSIKTTVSCSWSILPK